MATYPYRTRSRAHPIHGILSAYPLAFFTAAFVTDIVYADSADMMWANFSAWLIAGGIVTGLLAAVAGIVDAAVHRGQPRRRPSVAHNAAHNLATIFMMAFALVNAFVHARDAWTSVVPTGLILSGVTTALALVASWLGFTLEQRWEGR